MVLCVIQIVLSVAAAMVAFVSVWGGQKLGLVDSAKLFALTFLLVGPSVWRYFSLE